MTSRAWAWNDITPEQTDAPSSNSPADGVQDERWLTLKLLARQRKAGTRAGYRHDINAFLGWWGPVSRERLPLQARKTDLEDSGYDIHLAHPLRTRAIAAARVKTDAVDAKTLAHLLRADLLPEAYVAPRELRDVRELLRHRVALTGMRSA